ncbi:hypothetical protein C4571_03360 [Candidatus Parcubacteria bacterium]|nr:MAG: hypothetical protein C4571_03360 [Candidatus Parcubacteria bacterium]
MPSNGLALTPVRKLEEMAAGRRYLLCLVPPDGNGGISFAFCEARTCPELMTAKRKGKGESFRGIKMKALTRWGNPPIETGGDGHFHANLEQFDIMNVPGIRMNRNKIFAVPPGIKGETLMTFVKELKLPD